MSNKVKSFVTAVAIVVPLLLPVTAVAEDSLRFKTPATCTTGGGSVVDISPGRYMPEDVYLEWDARYKAHENAITRLEAENASLKSNVKTESLVGWKTAVGAAMLGVFAGRYVWGE